MRFLEGLSGKPLCLAYSPDGSKLAAGCTKSSVAVWDTAGWCRVGIWKTAGRREPVSDVLFLPDNRTVASIRNTPGAGSPIGEVHLWDLAVAYNSTTLDGRFETEDAWMPYLQATGFQGVAYEPRSQTLATGGSDHTVRLWTLPGGERRVPYSGHCLEIGCLAYSPDGRFLASGSDDRTVQLWDVGRGGVPRASLRHSHAVRAVAFSPDGATLATAAGSLVRLWNVKSTEERGTLKGHKGAVTSVAFSPDGRRAMTGGEDRLVRLWDPVHDVQVRCYRWDIGKINAVAFSPDGQTAAAAGARGGVLVWDLAD